MKNLKEVEKHQRESLKKFQNEIIIEIMRGFLNDENYNVRLNTVKFFKIILENSEITKMYRAKHIHIMISRSIDKNIPNELTTAVNTNA
jgi:hypothetical protein